MLFFCVKSGVFRAFTPYRTPYRIFGGIFRGYLVGDFLKIGLHSVRALLFHFLRNMAVRIKGEAGRGVAEVLLDGFYIVPLLKGYDGVGVAQIVEAGIGSAHLLGGLLKPFKGGLGHDIPPVGVRKHKAEVVQPCGAHQIAERFALPDHRQKGGKLCLFERLDLLFLHAGKGAIVGGVHANITELQRLFKGFVEDPVDVLYGFRGKVHFALEAVIERLFLGAFRLMSLILPLTAAEY